VARVKKEETTLRAPYLYRTAAHAVRNTALPNLRRRTSTRRRTGGDTLSGVRIRHYLAAALHPAARTITVTSADAFLAAVASPLLRCRLAVPAGRLSHAIRHLHTAARTRTRFAHCAHRGGFSSSYTCQHRPLETSYWDMGSSGRWNDVGHGMAITTRTAMRTNRRRRLLRILT